ncbi:hypothetical protein QQS21_005219 [Conoideocrella luteorostrata]|uniref:ER-bound oxygenase mpaB/mpaB'/Rubber oxygenase catalytic domain-containing protein n=1 Tax=Conoideocrella luteorostrata TaxID=1105319 RepID=A0AAJ0CPV7_9HYPO|nr:hypothetical protein QQS21_005219 [Conoideocrella luteorostrata]
MAVFPLGNHSFQWSEAHLSTAKLTALKQQYDYLGSETVIRLQEISKKESGGERGLARIDLYALLRDHQPDDKVLAKFWQEVHTVPEWVEWKQIERGQRFFYRYALGNLMGFALQGFMGENAASPGTAEVLVRTGGFATQKLMKRLMETFQFLLQVTDSLEAIQPGGAGHITTVRVRLLHSSVRERILGLVQAKPDYLDTVEFGQPVNDMDSIRAITTFCCNHSWLQLPLMGVKPSPQETADYIALFRYISYVIGAPSEHFETTERAKAAMESIGFHETKITPTSRIVAHNFVQCLVNYPPSNISVQFIEAGCRILNGDKFCDLLGLGDPRIYSYACFRGFIWLIRILAFIQHLSPILNDAITSYFHRTLHHAIIQSKSGLSGGSKLEFKHIPRIAKKTTKVNNNRSQVTPPFWARPVEALFFTVFVTVYLVPIVFLVLISGVAQMYIYRSKKS